MPREYYESLIVVSALADDSPETCLLRKRKTERARNHGLGIPKNKHAIHGHCKAREGWRLDDFGLGATVISQKRKNAGKVLSYHAAIVAPAPCTVEVHVCIFVLSTYRCAWLPKRFELDGWSLCASLYTTHSRLRDCFVISETSLLLLGTRGST